MQERFTEYRGTRIRMQESGTGPTVLFLHGAGGGIAPTSTAATKLAESVRLIAPDHPGYSLSDEPDWLENIHDLAYFYLGLIEELDLADIHLVGNSLGGWIALEMAVRNRTRMKSLTLFAPAGVKPKGVTFGDSFLWGPEERIRNAFHDQSIADKILAMPVTPEQIQINLKNAHSTALLGWEPRFYDPFLHKWLHLIDLPTRIIWGDDDKIFPLPHAERVQSLIPGSELHVLHDCGHLAHAERPADFVSHILASVRANP